VTTPAPDAADYPPYDSEAFRLLTAGLGRKSTTARLAQDPNDPEIIRDLLTQERTDEALLVLRRIVSAYPERMPRAFEAIYGQGTRFSSRAHGQPQALQEIVNAAKAQLPRLSREDAARVARQLLLVDRQSTCPGENRIETYLRCFVEEYAGTETALLTGNQRPLVVRPFWDRFFPTTEWRQTPGQTAPTITDIEFLDPERTKAAARIQAANHGATVMLQKSDGIWRVIELVDSWIS
jgi:hypothetical protein